MTFGELKLREHIATSELRRRSTRSKTNPLQSITRVSQSNYWGKVWNRHVRDNTCDGSRTSELTLAKIEVGILFLLALWTLKALTNLWDTISVDKRGASKSIHPHFDCSCNCGSILDPLAVRNMTSGAGNDNLTPPDLPGSSEDGTVRDCLLIPVGSHKIHVFAKDNSAIVDGERSTSAGEFLFYGDESWV